MALGRGSDPPSTSATTKWCDPHAADSDCLAVPPRRREQLRPQSAAAAGPKQPPISSRLPPLASSPPSPMSQTSMKIELQLCPSAASSILCTLHRKLHRQGNRTEDRSPSCLCVPSPCVRRDQRGRGVEGEGGRRGVRGMRHLQELVVRPCGVWHGPLHAHVPVQLVEVLPELLNPHP